jgi:aminopeptidase N
MQLVVGLGVALAEEPPPVPTHEEHLAFVRAHSGALGTPDWQFESRAVHDEYDVTHYDIDLNLDFTTHVINGTVEVQATAQVADLTEIDLDFYDPMVVDGATAGGSATTWVHASPTLTVTLDDTYQIGEAFTVTCTYHGTPSYTLSPFRWSSHLGVPMILSYSEPNGAPAWWVCKDDPKDKATYAIHVTAADSLFTVSNGLLESWVQNGNGTSTSNWVHDYPMSTYLFSIATTNFDSWTEVYTALDSVTTMDVDYFAYPEDLTDAQVSWSRNLEMMEYYVSIFGEYPFLDEKYAIAEFNHPGAMEHQTCTSMGSGWINGTHSNDFVVAHELSHSWVGDMITMTDWNHTWTKEGFATICEAFWFESIYGHNYYHTYMNSLNPFSYANLQLYAISPPLHAAIYYKGAWVLHMLRYLLGDEDFFEAIYTYTNTPAFLYGVADTDDMRGVFEAVSGMDLGWFFDQWIYSPGYMQCNQYWQAEPAGGGGYDVSLILHQVQTIGPYFKMPLDVLVQTNLGNETFTVWDSLYAQSFEFHVDGEPFNVVVDPDDWVLFRVVSTTEAAAGAPTLEVFEARAAPNPFNPSTTISFSLPERAHARLRIFDAGGRLVRELFDRDADRGLHQVVWDGRRMDGSPSSSGVYYHRLEASGRVHTGSVALVK